MNMTYDAVKLIKNFLSNRKQSVCINNTNSTTEDITCGVPQGSKLAALFYIILINDIFETRFHGEIQLYADDIALTYSCNSIDILRTQMQNDLTKLKSYLDKNELIINIKKTNYVIYREKDLSNFTLLYDNQKINRTSQITYLGLRINSKLNWTTHIEFIKNKITPFIGALKRVSFRLPTNLLLYLYYAYIHSTLTYMIPIWGISPKYELNTIQRLQNKAIKTIFKKPWNTPTHELYTNEISPIFIKFYLHIPD